MRSTRGGRWILALTLLGGPFPPALAGAAPWDGIVVPAVPEPTCIENCGDHPGGGSAPAYERPAPAPEARRRQEEQARQRARQQAEEERRAHLAALDARAEARAVTRGLARQEQLWHQRLAEQHLQELAATAAAQGESRHRYLRALLLPVPRQAAPPVKAGPFDPVGPAGPRSPSAREQLRAMAFHGAEAVTVALACEDAPAGDLLFRDAARLAELSSGVTDTGRISREAEDYALFAGQADAARLLPERLAALRESRAADERARAALAFQDQKLADLRRELARQEVDLAARRAAQAPALPPAAAPGEPLSTGEAPEDAGLSRAGQEVDRLRQAVAQLEAAQRAAQEQQERTSATVVRHRQELEQEQQRLTRLAREPGGAP